MNIGTFSVLHGICCRSSEVEILTDPKEAALARDLFISKKADKRHSAGTEFVVIYCFHGLAMQNWLWHY